VQEINQRTGDVLAAVILFAIGLVWVLGARAMPHGEFAVPGPGSFPMFLGAGLCGSAVLLLIAARRGGAGARVRFGNASIWSTVVALLALAVLFEPLGFFPSIAIFVGFFLRLLSGFRWSICVIAALAAAWVVYLFFGVLLGIPLPIVRWL
jgi:putative tricarboxylic transport membrane protein